MLSLILNLLSMNLFSFLPLLQFAQTSADAATAPPFWSQLPFIVIMIALFYFMLIRPQSKAKKEQETLISSAKTGDKVVTSGGIVGTIANVKEKSVMIKIADNVKIEVMKTHLTSVTRGDGKSDSTTVAATAAAKN